MGLVFIFMTSMLFVLISPFTNAQISGSLSIAPSFAPDLAPAPAPAPHFVDLKYLLSVAGSFHTFLKYLESTNVIHTFQAQANNTNQGITIFVADDKAFESLKKPSLSNLTADELKSLVLFHGLPQFHTLAEFNNLSVIGSVDTFAGGQYKLNVSDLLGSVQLSTGWTNTKIISSVLSTNPVAIYQVSKVLLPEAIFGTAPPPAPAPAPSLHIGPAADSSPVGSVGGGSPPSSSLAASHSVAVVSGLFEFLVSAVSCGLILFL